MRSTPSSWPIFSLVNREKKIDPKPQYQRGSVWTEEKKQLLMDTILRQYDIPKFYLRVVNDGGYEHEVVDGQQRIRCIWSFVNNEFPLGNESKHFDDLPDLSGKYYKDLTGDQQDRIVSFTLTVTELFSASDIEVRELFLRLQEGTTLNPPEKRNAMTGNMRNFVTELGQHSIFVKTTMKNDRFQYDDLAAHVSKLEVNSGSSDVKASDLKAFYEAEVGFKVESKQAQKIKRVLNFLDKVFKDNTPELGIKWGFVDLYLLVSHLMDSYDIKDRHQDVHDFYIGFEGERRKVSDPSELLVKDNDWNKDLYDYINSFQREGAKRANIQKRHDVYLRKFLNDYPDLVAKDSSRSFTRNERITIWRHSGQKCENPSCGIKVGLDEMHADHILPHSRGGKTSIENGQCLCVACNSSKKDKLLTLVD